MDCQIRKPRRMTMLSCHRTTWIIAVYAGGSRKSTYSGYRVKEQFLQVSKRDMIREGCHGILETAESPMEVYAFFHFRKEIVL